MPLCLLEHINSYTYLEFQSTKKVLIKYNFNFNFLCSLAQSVKLAMALAIFLSYGLQLYVPVGIMWPAIKNRLESEKAQKYGEYFLRIILVIFTCK